MADGCELTIVLPAYHEAEVLRHLLPRICTCAAQFTSAYEVLVVDAVAPVDDTQRVCAEVGVRHIFRQGSDSYGDAVRAGIRESRGRFVIIMDADGSHNPDDLVRLWQRRHAYDVVIGSRYTAGGTTKVHAGLTLMSLFLNAVYRLLLGLQPQDLSNSFRVYRGQQLRSLSLESTNFEIVEEILVALVWGPAHAKVTEVPITFEKRNAGESKRRLPSFILSYLRSLPRLRRFRATAMAGCGETMSGA
jgi:dolichol-phosphate mannosyltransferase